MRNARGKLQKPNFLFVYGTLMRGGNLHHLLRPQDGAIYVGEGKIRGLLYGFRGANYPGAVATREPGRFVHGELYSLSEANALLERLDRYEGCDEGLFVRQDVQVLGGKRLRAWAYFYARPLASAGAALIPGGRFPAEHSLAERSLA
jgi:gamma-glutamylcyclotransferase (GGCT)/AIG2-like uncharacterized protein YtfP